jgi:hypothetical protein
MFYFSANKLKQRDNNYKFVSRDNRPFILDAGLREVTLGISENYNTC